VNASWALLAFAGGLAILFAINKAIASLSEARDTLEEILDATLDHNQDGKWESGRSRLLTLEEAEWDDEVRDYILRTPGSDDDPR
jgi:hypothetical protein